MEPIVGAPTVVPNYKPPVKTILSLARYAEIMGINPIQFMSGTDTGILFPTTGCTDRWWHFPWQDSNKVSRTDIAMEIKRAEQDITSQLKYFPGPNWIEEEEQPYTKYHRRELTAMRGFTPNGQYKSVNLKYGKHVAFGKRAVSLVAADAGVIYTDDDGDGFSETATIMVPTSLTNACEIKVYHPGYLGNELYEIRPIKTKQITGGNAIITFDVWYLFKLSLQSAWPGSSVTGPAPIDATDSDSYVTSVDVYREYADPAEQCTLYWEGAPYSYCDSCGGTGCPSCDSITQVACIQPRSEFRNSVVVIPAIYDSGSFTPSTFCAGREPDRVKVSYMSGDYEILNGCREVPDDLAQAIAYIATARLSRPLCTDCENVSAKEQYLSTDLIYITRGESNDTKFVTREVSNCPFGTTRGEVEAYRIIKRRQRQGLVRRSATVI